MGILYSATSQDILGLQSGGRPREWIGRTPSCRVKSFPVSATLGTDVSSDGKSSRQVVIMQRTRYFHSHSTLGEQQAGDDISKITKQGLEKP